VKLVAIGCSWGGLAALTVVLGGLPDDLDAAVVVAQHRAADVYLLEPLLEERSALPLREVSDKDVLRRGHVHLAPPDYHLLVEPGHVALSTEPPVRFARPSVDVLFESAADAYGPGCVGVVLTGANDDGAAGLAAIARAGGRAIVQEPETAERPEMPRAALAAVPDALTLPLAEIAGAVAAACAERSGV
jgi:two-component system chemotaxis response regulator CheB